MGHAYVAAQTADGSGGIELWDTADAAVRRLVDVPYIGVLARHGENPVLYGIEHGDAEHLRAWRIDARDVLTDLARIPLPGMGACSLAQVGDMLVVAHFFTGEISLVSLDPGGTPLAVTRTVVFEGSGPEDVQDRSRPHHVSAHPDGLLVADFGADVLRVLDPVDLSERRVISLRAGSGPRHVAWLDESRFALTAELSRRILVFDGDLVADVPATGVDSGDRVYPSDLVVHPGGWLISANRNAGTLALFDLRDGVPRLVEELPCGGSWPLTLALCGDEVVVAQRDDDLVLSFRLDAAAGTLTPASRAASARPYWVLPA